MGSRILAVTIGFTVAATVMAADRSPTDRPRNDLPKPRTVLWIGAHPDDETVAAPLLAFWCRAEGAKCTFLTLTRGEAGECARAAACQPDLASARSAEAASSAQYFHADLILLSLADGGGSAEPAWRFGSTAFGQSARRAVARFITAIGPDLVLTFDPRHGTTCHPDHRALAHVVYDALKSSGASSSLYYLETVASLQPQAADIEFGTARGVSEALTFDANGQLQSIGAPAWAAMANVLRRYPSQFDDRYAAAVSRTPNRNRMIVIAPGFAPPTSDVPCKQQQ